MVLIAVIAIACDSFQSIEIVNETSLSIDITFGHSAVPKQIGEIDLATECAVCRLGSATNGSFAGPPSDSRRGQRFVYRISAHDSSNEIILFSQVFTWDELRNNDWKVHIADMR